MASALGYSLGDVISVDYSKRSIDINYHEKEVLYSACDFSSEYPSLDITPENVEATDTVETIWTLK